MDSITERASLMASSIYLFIYLFIVFAHIYALFRVYSILESIAFIDMLLYFLHRIAGEAYAEFLEDLSVHFA